MSVVATVAPELETVLTATGIRKSFGPNEVLHGIDLVLRAGEVHALLGENGAGKSTLVKILAGFQNADAGRIHVNGEPVSFDGPRSAEDLGIVLIHQEFNLAEHLNVEESIFLGRELLRGPFVDKPAMVRISKEILESLQTDIDPATAIKDLATPDKQMVEIAKAISRNARILIMDEPTAVLTEAETPILFGLIRRLKERGVAILYISHKLAEVEEIADQVTVLRDGELIGCCPASDITKDDMARMMVGRDMSDMFPEKILPADDAAETFRVENLSVGGIVQDASFFLRAGEVLGFAGVVGSGRTALMEAAVGLRPKTNGRVYIHGQPVSLSTFHEAVTRGIAYLSEDRKGKGLLLNMGMRPNLTLLNLSDYCTPLLDEQREEQALDTAIREFDIRVQDRGIQVGRMSGGNQQKLLLAKTMATSPDIVIINEPTRGIDVGTKHQVYQFIQRLTREGKSVVLISSEMPELIGLSHRIVVMCAGRITGTLSGEQLNEHEIMRYASGIMGVPANERPRD